MPESVQLFILRKSPLIFGGSNLLKRSGVPKIKGDLQNV